MNRDRRAPPLALWILSRLLRDARRDALIGDLTEEYQHGRTRLWYWRQALCAVAADVREHPPLRLVLGVLRLLIIVCLILGSSQGKWLIFLLMLDPSFWWLQRLDPSTRRLLRLQKDRGGRGNRRGSAPCDR